MPEQLRAIQPIGSTRGQLFQSLADRLAAFSRSEEDELDRQMQKKAKEKGLTDAQGKTQLMLTDGTTIADEAWNEGAQISHLAAVKLDLNENLTRIAGESARDPIAYNERAKAYSAGLIENLDPRLQPIVQNEVSEVILKQRMTLEADERTFIREQQATEIGMAIDLYETDALNKALEGDLEASQDAQLRASMLIDSMETSDFWKSAEAVARRKKLNRKTEVEMVKGEFIRQMNIGRARQFLDKFAALKEISDWTPDDRRKVEKEMIGMMGKQQGIDADGLKADRDARKERWRIGLRKVSKLMADGDLTADILATMVANDQLNPVDEAKYKAAAVRGGPEFSDQVAINLLQEKLLTVSDADIMANTDITLEDRLKIVEDKERLEADLGNWRNTQNGIEGVRRINGAFKIRPGLAVRPTPEQLRKSDIVLTQYFDTVESLPLEERGVRSLEIADKLVSKIKNEDISQLIDKKKDKIESLDFQTEEEIDDSDLDNEQKNAAKTILRKKLNDLKRLETQRDQLN